MAVRLEFINILIPVANVRKCDGAEEWLALEVDFAWNDGSLLRIGAMSPPDVDDIVGDWVQRGLVPFVEESGIRKWKDVCVVDSANGLRWACDWIEFDLEARLAWLKGEGRDVIAGPKGRDVDPGIPLGKP